MRRPDTFVRLVLGGFLVMVQVAPAAVADVATDLRIDPKVRAFLVELNKNSSPFWELPQP